MESIITSESNNLIKMAKSLHKKKGRKEFNCFFIEGVRLVKDCIISNGNIHSIIYSDMLHKVNEGRELYKLISQKGYKTYKTTDKIMKLISDTNNPQGIFAITKYKFNSVQEILKKKDNFILILDRVQDPGNMGTIIRTADALGANGIIISKGCVDVFNPKTIRATMGSIFHMPLLYSDDIQSLLRTLKKNGISIMSTDLRTDKFCYNIDFNTDFALVIGNEANGLKDDILRESDLLIKIPMVGKAESLNAAMAAGIVMYEASRQRQNF